MYMKKTSAFKVFFYSAVPEFSRLASKTSVLGHVNVKKKFIGLLIHFNVITVVRTGSGCVGNLWLGARTLASYDAAWP